MTRRQMSTLQKVPEHGKTRLPAAASGADTVMAAGGKSYAMSSDLATRLRRRMAIRNTIAATIIASFGIFTCTD